jgi:DNA helicase-2/ATP-dependent DNA helicase PcrA
MNTQKFNAAQWVGLSDQQAEVIRWVLDDTGSLELRARAGCGKTFTLMKVVKAIAEFKLGDCAIMAYNKKIADEIKVKLDDAGYDWRIAQAGTVHSFGFQAWRKVCPSVQIDDKKIKNIIRDESVRFPEAMILKVAGDAIAKMVSLAKQRAFGHLVDIADTAEWMDIFNHFGIENDVTEDVDVAEIVSACKQIYRISMNTCSEVIDFDDMILAPLIFRARFWPKDWILVDESQDTNPARRALALAMLKPKTGRMIFVGDPAQAIYGFTGADSDSMNQLSKATSAKMLPLNVTRRCPKAVVEQAKRLVPDFTAHEDAPEGIVRSIQYAEIEAEKLNKSDAILCRNTAPLVKTAYSLISKGIACKVEGREIGSGLIKLARRWKIKTLDKLLTKLEDYQARQTAKFMSRDQEDRVQGLVDQVECLRIVIGRCQAQNKHSIEDLVTDIESMFGNTPEGQQPSVLTLSTGHKSKGREFKRVYLLDMSKYCPSPYAKKPWQQEQEANLEYVMITRAMSELIYVNSEE